MATEKKQSFLGGAAVLAFGIVAVKIIGAVFKIPLRNILGEGGSADFSNAYNIYATLLTVSTAGLPVALSKLVSESYALGRTRQAHRTFRVSLSVFLVLGVASFALMWWGSDLLAGFLNNPRAAYGIRALAPAVVCVGCLSAFRGYAQGRQYMTPTAVSQILEALCKLVFGLALSLWLLKIGQPDYIAAAGAIAGVTAGTILSLVYMAIDYLRHRPALRRGEGKFLLCGVTGSGKTEVYIRAVREALALGKAAIVLVPEIALTPQMVSWFRARFGAGAAVLHSRLSPGERFDEWRRIRRGEARVVIGARSAVFAPCEKLGVIIIDEEHEQSYLSDKHPRYDAREVAQRRCEHEGGTLILASATPSLKTFARALPNMRSSLGHLTLLEMPRRVLNRPLPEIEVVDMRRELELGNRSVFSGRLDSALRACLARGEQAMLFLNRRGYATFVSCRACGHVMKCPECDVSLTYHREGDMLRCHYCGLEMKPPKTCPECGSPYIRYFGTGTQKVEEALKERFPGVASVRMDLDTTSGKDAHAKLLDAFRRGDAQVLIGTQMIAKGLDFPRVTLVGVIAADATLNLPDYRSPERTFELIVQVAGRAGRAEQKGHVIVQTYDPENYAIEAAARQDFRAFFETEFSRRRRGLYPPFTMLTRLLVEAADEKRAQQTAEALAAEMEAFFEKNPLLRRQTIQMRAMEAPVKKLRGKARWQVFLKLYSRGPTPQVLEKLESLAQRPVEGAQVYLEIDPATML